MESHLSSEYCSDQTKYKVIMMIRTLLTGQKASNHEVTFHFLWYKEKTKGVWVLLLSERAQQWILLHLVVKVKVKEKCNRLTLHNKKNMSLGSFSLFKCISPCQQTSKHPAHLWELEIPPLGWSAHRYGAEPQSVASPTPHSGSGSHPWRPPV